VVHVLTTVVSSCYRVVVVVHDRLTTGRTKVYSLSDRAM